MKHPHSRIVGKFVTAALMLFFACVLFSDATVAATFVRCIRMASALAETFNLLEFDQLFRPNSRDRPTSYRLVQV